MRLVDEPGEGRHGMKEQAPFVLHLRGRLLAISSGDQVQVFVECNLHLQNKPRAPATAGLVCHRSPNSQPLVGAPLLEHSGTSLRLASLDARSFEITHDNPLVIATNAHGAVSSQQTLRAPSQCHRTPSSLHLG